MGEQDPIETEQVRDPKSHDPEADSENAWHGRDRIEPRKPGEPASNEKAIPPAR
jgi:hypothetical protein